MLKWFLTLLAACAFAIGGTLAPQPAQAAPAEPGGSSSFAQPNHYYLALGDSVAYGFQLYKTLLPPVTASEFDTGYVNDLSDMLRVLHPDMQTVNYACPGQSTVQFLSSTTCPLPLHDPYNGTQMDAALAFLSAHPGQVSPITITMGINDALQVLAACGGLAHLDCVIPKLPGVFQQIQTNLAIILAKLRAVAPDAQILIMQYYDPYAAIAPVTVTLAAALNQIIAGVAAKFGATPVDTFTPINVNPPQPQNLCKLTLICTPLQDIHPTDAGYLVIAQQFYKAGNFGTLGQVLVNFSSSAPGQGYVFFGPGPGCLGLVEVATRDVLSGTSQHTVVVTGDDMNIGSTGLLPGQTYSYETVTLTSSGVEIDNNGGTCFTFTAPGP